MPTPQPEDDQENPGKKLQFHETLADEARPDSVQLCQSSCEPSLSEAGSSLSVDGSRMPDSAAQPSTASFETGAASFQPVDQCRQTASLATDELPSAVTSDKNIAESYKVELLMHSLQTLIPELVRHGRDKEAEIGSRLLVDLTEHRVTAGEAKEIFELIQAKHQGEAVQRYADLSRGAKNRKALVAASIALFMLVSVTAMNMVGSHHRGPHQPRLAGFPSQPDCRFLPVSMENKLHSFSYSTTTSFTITNKLDKPVSMYWLNYQGDRVLYANLEPGRSVVQQTFLTHPWLVVDDEGKAIMLFLPGTNQNQQVEVQ
jgi:hypothetical protein